MWSINRTDDIQVTDEMSVSECDAHTLFYKLCIYIINCSTIFKVYALSSPEKRVNDIYIYI